MKLKIGAIEYDVREVEDLHTTDEQGHKVAMHGAIYPDESMIRLEQDQNQQQKVATLWHEAVHAILNQAGHTEHDESHVIALGYGLQALVKDNPDLVAITVWDGGNLACLIKTYPSVLPSPDSQQIETAQDH